MYTIKIIDVFNLFCGTRIAPFSVKERRMLRFLSAFSLCLIFTLVLFQVPQVGANEAASKLEVVIYHADWCGPCRALKQALLKAGYVNSVPVSISGKIVSVPIRHVKVESFEELTEKGGVTQSLPEIQFRGNGKLLGNLSGYHEPEEILSSLQNFANPPLAGASHNHNISRKNFSSSAVVIIGTGKSLESNPIFVGQSILSSKSVFLSQLKAPENSIATLYGVAGPEKDCQAGMNCDFTFSELSNDGSKKESRPR